jgi:hypothetical protein
LVIDGSLPADEPELVEAGATAAGEDLGGEYRLAGGGFNAVLDGSAPAHATAVRARSIVKAPRPKRKERNAAAEFIKIMLGGLVGIGLAPLVLWWVFGNDILELGPRVAPYAPWLVPARFHAKPESQTTADATVGPSTQPAPKPGAGRTKDAAAKPEPPLVTELPLEGAASAQGEITSFSLTEPPNSTPSLDALSGAASDAALSPKIQLTPQTEPEPKAPPDTLPEAKAESKPEPKPESAPTPEPKPADPPLPTASDLQKAVAAAADGFTKVNESTGQPAEVRKQLYTEMYLAACEVGRIVSYLNSAGQDPAEPIAQLKKLLGELAVQPGKVSALKSLTDIHLPQRKADEGVLLVGVVQDFFQPAGSLYACTLQSGKSLSPTPLIAASNPEEFCKPGDELILVGRVVENPRKNLRGYEGDHPQVVLLGYAVPVPKAEVPPP